MVSCLHSHLLWVAILDFFFFPPQSLLDYWLTWKIQAEKHKAGLLRRPRIYVPISGTFISIMSSKVSVPSCFLRPLVTLHCCSSWWEPWPVLGAESCAVCVALCRAVDGWMAENTMAQHGVTAWSCVGSLLVSHSAERVASSRGRALTWNEYST